MSNWDFPGAKWWKFDFHTHTPASTDFEYPKLNPETWLLEFMKRGIDCIAVTDHNSGEWIGQLKQALLKLELEQPEDFRTLYLFPGVEISANSGVHILAIFDPEKTGSDIDSLLGAVGYQGKKGASDEVTNKSITEVVNFIVQHGGIAIPAHVNKQKGLFSVKGASLEQVLNNRNIYAMELCDKDFSTPELYVSNKTDWTEVCGSDFHGESSGTFTWVKMGLPSIEGLRLALIDGGASVNQDMDAEPNQHAEYAIEEIIVKGAKYMGRPEALECSFSPFLNSIIGGRGSGKSSLMEFIRLAVRRTQELPERFLKDSNQSYFSSDEAGGLLTQDSQLHVIYRKGDTRYRLNWDSHFSPPSLEEWYEEEEAWMEIEGEIASLFPVRIFSQKQIFELASEPQGLLRVIDGEAEVEVDKYQSTYMDYSHECKMIAQQEQQLNEKIKNERQLKGKINDLRRQIGQVEKSGHKISLQNYRLRQQQITEVSFIKEHWKIILDNLSKALSRAEPVNISQKLYTKHPVILRALKNKQRQWQQQIDRINEIIVKLMDDLQNWEKEDKEQEWINEIDKDLQQYESLCTQLEKQGIDPKTYPDLLQNFSQTERELKLIADSKQKLETLRDQYNQKCKELKKERMKLTDRRKKFLKRVLQDNEFVMINISPFAEPWSNMEKSIRKILQIEKGNSFERDMEEIKNIFDEYIFDGDGWERMKSRIRNIRLGKENAKDKRFMSHLKGLPTETMIDLDLWFPEDSLVITFGKDNKVIHEGSPGQKSAALLAFVLAHGDEPLLLDQPEDDLDNELIYKLIVQAIRDKKTERQIIVITHNANIVVNGDSEMVHSLMVANGQSHLESGNFQTESVRKRICDTMEGGRKAFDQRYRRIHLEN